MGTELKKELGLIHVVMLCTGAIMGTGIFIIPGVAGGLMGPGSIILWVLIGLLTIPISLCFIELASSYNVTGGPYVYIREAMGDFWGFITGWTAWLMACIYIGTHTIAIRYYLDFFYEMTFVEAAVLYAGVIGVITLINYAGVKQGGRTQLFLTLGTFSVLAIFIILGLPKVDMTNFDPLFPLGLSALGMTAVLIVEPFIGWETTTVIAGEVKDTKRNIPLGLVISTIIIMTFYLLVVFVTLGVMPWQLLKDSISPMADVMALAYGSGMGAIMTAGAIIVSLACLNAWILTTARLPYAMAKDKLFLGSFGNINRKYNTPSRSLLVQAVIAFIITLTGSYEGAVFLLMANALILYALSALSVIKLKKKPVDRLIDLPVAVPMMALLLCIILFTQIPFELMISGLMLIAFGVPIYTMIRVTYDRKFLEKFYNTFSPLYDILSPMWYGKGRREKVILKANIKKGDIVLDYGCATGADVLMLADKVGREGKIVAVDISIKQLERSVEKVKKLPGHPNVVFVKEDRELVPFESSTFDRIISVGVLSYQPDPGKLLHEFRRVLRKGGRVSIMDFGRALFIPKAKYLKSRESIKKTFNSAGFKKINIEKTSSISAEYYYITAVK
ncbi:MAG: amino acid permease [Candidatus Aenigmatarchaeota archaeon]|nr:MAG: amino acid permease [Candidatus Aenigmarchaeota archaeon]